MAIFRRSWRLTLQIGNDKAKIFQEITNDDMSLKIEFDITSNTASYSEGTITLYNLAKDDMYYLVSCARIGADGIMKQNKVMLECGYGGDLGIILSGNIYEVTADFTSADRKITLKARGNIAKNFEFDSVSVALNGDIDLKDICKELTKKQQILLEYDKNIQPIIQKGYSFLGRPTQMLENLRKSFKNLFLFYSEDGERLIVQSKENATISNKQPLSYETGLIGTPTPTQYGIQATSLLNKSLKMGGWIELNSLKIPQYNGVYYIYQIKHKGSNQNNEWFSILSLSKNVMNA